MEAARRNRELVVQAMRSDAGTYGIKTLYNEFVESEQANRFFLLRMGWHNGKDYHSLVRDAAWREDGTIIIYLDITEDDLAEELIEAGVPADKIIKAYDPDQQQRLQQVVAGAAEYR